MFKNALAGGGGGVTAGEPPFEWIWQEQIGQAAHVDWATPGWVSNRPGT